MMQLSLIPTEQLPDWIDDDWETPDIIAQQISQLIAPHEFCCEPSAGTGQIAQYLKAGTHCIDINPDRVRQGRIRNPDKAWFCNNFLTLGWAKHYDVIVTNPPFSKGMEFIEHGLPLLKPTTTARLLFLLPVDYFQAIKRHQFFKSLDAHIHTIHPIVGRIAYLKRGIPHTGRQVCDAVFDIRPGKGNGLQFLTCGGDP